MIKREKYLQELISYKDVNIIKVLIGIRNCGKTTILLQYVSILQNQKDSNIIFIDFNEYETIKAIKNTDDLNDYIHSKYLPLKKNYLLIDEVQEIDKFQLVLNSWSNKKNMDIYVTGSNSKLLSSEISTLLTGKNIVIKVYPLTFSEMQEYYDEGKVDSLNERFNDFFTFGGMPGRTNFNDKTKIYNYLNMIYGDILQNDILSKKAVLDVNELTNIYRLIFDNIGKELSYKNIYEKLKNNNSTISQNTIVKYVELLQNSFLVQKINKFDLSGKKILENLYKYYPMDFGMRNAMFKNFSHNRGKILENIVLNELKYRGYEVFIGTSRTISEIDFVAKNNNEILYFQVCETITEDNIERETTPLTKINNSFPKIVLSLDTLESNDQNVIQFKNIINWLLKQ